MLREKKEQSISKMMRFSNNGTNFYYSSDLFIPAAFEQAINRNNADKFKCKLII